MESASDLDTLAGLVAAGGVVVLTGAGISTDSGIPDYRGPSGASRRHTPMTYQAFVADPAARARYWARAMAGWHRIASARPNDGHRAVTALQSGGVLDAVITQNVDGLHQAAGTRDVVELHGGLDRTRCLGCGDIASRHSLDEQVRAANPDLVLDVATVNPDGDAELGQADFAGFRAPVCLSCGSDLIKPDVVFFGESVPPARVARCAELVAAARSVLVLGSSLTVFSGYRFARAAARAGVPLAIVNQGPTRADELADVRVDAPLASVLPSLAAVRL